MFFLFSFSFYVCFVMMSVFFFFFFFFQAEDGIRDLIVTGVQTCALPICVGVNWIFRKAARPFSENFLPSVQVTSRSPQILSETARKFLRALSAIVFWLKLVRISSLQ